VHGRNPESRTEVTQFLLDLGLEPVILDEQPGRGRTLIEKIEHYGDVAFAVVLMLAEDMGGLKHEFDARFGALERGEVPFSLGHGLAPRARQNVTFEHGYFAGRLGRSRMCVLMDRVLDKPSDIDGIEYVPYGPDGVWKGKLERELRAADIYIQAREGDQH